MSIRILLILLLLSFNSFSEICNCKITIPAYETFVDGSKYAISPGDTVCIASSKKKYFQLKNFTGDSLRPIVFINYGGEVVIENDNFYYGIRIANCKYFKLLGNGDINTTYGIKIKQTGPDANGLSIADFSSDFEIAFLEISNTGFAGIIAKTDPDCEEKAWRHNFIMKNVSIHHNYIHDVAGEGLYIGHSFYSGWRGKRQCPDKVLFPHELANVAIYDNVIDNCGFDGVQVGCGSNKINIYKNYVSNFGVLNQPQQNNGIQIGEGTSARTYNNIIKNGSGHGIIHLGFGENYLYNNLIVKTGNAGIFNDNRLEALGDKNYFINNTLLYCGGDGIVIYSDTTKSFCYNNLIINPGNFYKYESDNTSRTGNDSFIFLLHAAAPVSVESNCFILNDIPYDSESESYKYLITGYECVMDKGIDVSEFGITLDLYGKSRPQGKGFDAGVVEFEVK
ncbi:MAG TPA: right-handed parallel beta-helix repeat-containing protein [Cytophagaceae bacterium]